LLDFLHITEDALTHFFGKYTHTVMVRGEAAIARAVVALVVSAVLVWRFLRTGGPDMLRMMGSEGQSARDGNHAHHH
jgi:hypothetical protein